ncbi:MAG: hypothetical protein AAGG75_25565 [Bacteroidota bacterium]
MTRVVMLQGIPRQTALNEAPDRAAQAYPSAPPFAVLGNDRATSALLLHKMRILGSYYSDRPEVQRARQYVEDAIATGQTRTPGTSDIERQVAQKVSKLRLNRSSIGNNEDLVEEFFQRTLAGESLDYPKVAEACVRKHGCYFCDEMNICRAELRLFVDASNHINESGYHMLYEFAPANSPEAAVVTKRVLHRNAISNLAEITKLSRENMANWAEASVMEANRKKLLPPLYPAESIIELRDGIASGDTASVGAIPVAVAIIGAIAGALTAAAGVITSLRADASQLQYNAAGFGQPTFGPEVGDFPGSLPGAGGALGSSNLLPLALGAAGLFLLSK